MSKRLFSWLSWRKSRRFIHRPETLALLMADVDAGAVDHLVVTGDLTNLSLPEEFERARDWLRATGDGERVTVVPGNHDAWSRWRPTGGWACGATGWRAGRSPA